MAVLRGELELARCDLLVPGLEGDTHLEALVLDLLHALEGQGVGGRGGHVVVTQLLVARGELAHDGPLGELQVRAVEVLLPIDEEDLPLEGDVGLEPPGGGGIVAQLVEQRR